MKDEVIAGVLGIFFVLLLINLVAVFATRPGPGPTVIERPQVKTEVPTTETVCVQPAEGYCKRYETRRILRE